MWCSFAYKDDNKIVAVQALDLRKTRPSVHYDELRLKLPSPIDAQCATTAEAAEEKIFRITGVRPRQQE